MDSTPSLYDVIPATGTNKQMYKPRFKSNEVIQVTPTHDSSASKSGFTPFFISNAYKTILHLFSFKTPILVGKK